MGRDADAVETLTRALALDPQLVEARVYLANLMYDVGDLDAALVEFEKTKPEDHWDELGIWRVIELKKSVYELDESDGELKPWEARLVELADENDAIDDLLEEVEQSMMEQEAEAMPEAQGQLEALGSLLTGLVNQHHGEQAEPAFTDVLAAETSHRVIMRDGSVFEGTWEEIVRALRDARDAGRPLDEYMAAEARRFYGATGKQVASDAPEAFLRGGADAGMLRIDR
jgi:lipopolysaccharide biosynthesis regulator YciM